MENSNPNHRGNPFLTPTNKAPTHHVSSSLEKFRKGNHYEQLNVPFNASKKDVKAAYRKLCFKHHPDRLERVDEVNEIDDLDDIDDIDEIDEIDDVDDVDDVDEVGEIGDIDCVNIQSGASNKENAPDANHTKLRAAAASAAAADVFSPIKSPCRTHLYHQTMFDLVTKAYHVLSDPVQRARYDLEQGIVETTEISITALHKVQRQEACKELELMKVAYASKRKAEEACNGVIITSAKWGSMQSWVPSHKSIAKSATGNVIDAVVQLQCLVEASTLCLESGKSKIKTCPGLYDPSDKPGLRQKSRLCVRYEFRGYPHQIVVDDEEELKIPMQAHQLSASQRDASRKREKKSRKKSKKSKTSAKIPLFSETGAMNGDNEGSRWKHSTNSVESQKSVVGGACKVEEQDEDDDENDDAEAPVVTSSGHLFAVSVVTILAAGFIAYLYRKRQ